MAKTRRDTEQARIFAAFLRQQLRLREIGVMEFARQADVVHPMVVRWLNGENIPNPSSAKRIADVLGIPHWTVLEMAGHVDTANLGQSSGQRFARQFLAMTAGLPDEQVETILMAVNSLSTGLRGAETRRHDQGNSPPRQVVAV